ncbi:MAG: tRNA (adenosine(37)-N6)-threonylcarbamoyltransferase complex transferase subunit TsaD [Ignavibacteriaceae bacterium]|nr:tRNA (adenosine(37)-N6)-threonylcarbamoyltransferase complex transferase subunit TsaD [Ignavibacteriaceae bacterium]
MNVLGIETSCDETSVAIISENVIAANLISSQDFHNQYGGVVPELSSRAHLQIIIPLLKAALSKSGLNLNQIDLISATAGPGLIGALLVGLTFAKGLSFSLNKPFVPVNHIEGHIFSGFLMNDKPEFPFLVLVVSGGHTLLLLVNNFTDIKKLGTTVDDAAGEAFDKASKMLGLGYPGGPKIQNSAAMGEIGKISFPISELKDPFNFSFSGLKTAVLRFIQNHNSLHGQLSENDINDIAAAFQAAVIKALIRKTEKAINSFEVKSISLVGGVAANNVLREEFQKLGDKHSLKVVIPSMDFCGDNAAMIAIRAKQLYESGSRFDLDFVPFPGLTNQHFS